MKLARSGTMCVLLLGGAVLAGLSSQAADEPKTKEDPEKLARRAEAVAELGTAAQLIAFGRGELADETGLKNLRSPESLVAAAGILLRVNAAIGGKIEPLEARSADPKTAPPKGEPLKLTQLADEAKALFDEARAMVATDKARSAALEGLIKEALAVETRGAIGAPRAITRSLSPGQMEVLSIPFQPRAPATVTFRSAGRSRLHFEIEDNPGYIIFNRNGTNASHSWMTGAPGPRMITVRVRNVGKNPTTCTVMTN